MSEWWTYRPSDFLLFSPRVYERLIESHNAALGGWRWVALALGLALLALVYRGRPADGRAALGVAGSGLAASGCWFLAGRYAAINWAAADAAPYVIAAGVAMALAGLASPAPLKPARGLSSMLALAVVALGVLAFPAAGLLAGRPATGLQLFAIMPDPTALAALGLSALVARPLVAAALAIVPLGWALYAAMTLFTLGSAEGWIITAGILGFAGAVIGRIFARGEAGGRSAT